MITASKYLVACLFLCGFSSCGTQVRALTLPQLAADSAGPRIIVAPTVDPGFPKALISPVQSDISGPTFSTTGTRLIAVNVTGATTGGFGHVVRWAGGTPAGATAFTQTTAAYFNDGWNIWGEWWVASVSSDQTNVQAEYHETVASGGGDGVTMVVYSIAGTSGVGSSGVKNDQAGASTLSLTLPAQAEKSLILVSTYLEDCYALRPANTDLLTDSIEDENLTDAAAASAYNYVHYVTTAPGNVPVGYTTVNYNGSSGSKLAAGIELLAQ